MLTLAFQSLLADPKVPKLPDAPMLAGALLENPYPLAVILIVGGAAAVIACNRAGRLRIGLFVLGLCVCIGAGAIALSAAVKTTREFLREETERLVNAGVRGDDPTLDALLDDRLTVTFLGRPLARTKMDILTTLRDTVRLRYPIKSHEVRSVAAAIDRPTPSEAQTQVMVRVVPEATGFSHDSWWLLTWRADGKGGWRVVTIEAQHVDGMPPGSAPPL